MTAERRCGTCRWWDSISPDPATLATDGVSCPTWEPLLITSSGKSPRTPGRHGGEKGAGVKEQKKSE
jgi:hypothetical protein